MKKLLLLIPLFAFGTAQANDKPSHHIIRTIAKAAMIETPLEGVVLGAQLIHDHNSKPKVEPQPQEQPVVNPPEEKNTSDEKTVDSSQNDDDEDDYDYRAGVHKFGLTGP